MTIRAPTAFVQYPDESTMFPRRIIRGSDVGSVRGNQQLLLHAPMLIYSEIHEGLEVDNTSIAGAYNITGGTYFRRHILRGIDMCGVQATSPGRATVLAWCSASTAGTVLIENSTTSQTISFSVSSTSPTWQALVTTSGFWASAGSANTIRMYAWRTSGTGSVYYAGALLESAYSY